MLPDRCSVMTHKKQCVNPPEFIISVIDGSGEYMVGVTCARHKEIVSEKIRVLQDAGRIHKGKMVFAPVKAVGTDCINTDCTNTGDIVQIKS